MISFPSYYLQKSLLICDLLYDTGEGSCGLMVMSDSTKDPQRLWAWCTFNTTSWDKHRSAGVAQKFGDGCQSKRHPHHVTIVQNYEVRLKTALALLQKRDISTTK
ncbi:hypothetical protein AVEN_232156-1 [Araneus ventricosus]|uniref:Uncharacterized protein n=1 Tax=Araneus ventricosus TaxID=182803 RepID=A0A4Y2FYQ8_ARAVE|nr:hypothetical protein AVEN_232156-1 [Araneus ventricosus]